MISDPIMQYVLFALIIIVLTIMLIITAVNLTHFQHQKDYMNREIHRTTGREQQQWKRRKRRLILSVIPIVRLFVRHRSHHNH